MRDNCVVCCLVSRKEIENCASLILKEVVIDLNSISVERKPMGNMNNITELFLNRCLQSPASEGKLEREVISKV